MHLTRRRGAYMGDADIVIRGPPEGFSEALFVSLSHDAAVSTASPALELQLTLPGKHLPLKVLGLDPFRAAALQPALMGEIGADLTALFEPNTIVLSRAAAQELQLQRGESLPIVVGSSVKTLRVIDIMAGNSYAEPLGLMDIATAQWSLARIGRLNRIDLRLRPGTDSQSSLARVTGALPAAVVALTPTIESGRAATATRAYRVNLNMLALVALLTGAFLVFSTQSLSVLRRRSAGSACCARLGGHSRGIAARAARRGCRHRRRGVVAGCVAGRTGRRRRAALSGCRPR